MNDHACGHQRFTHARIIAAMIGKALAFDPVRQRCDLAFNGQDFVLDTTPLTPALISLGCDRRAHPDDTLPDVVTNDYAPQRLDARRGTPLDALDPQGRFIGSRLWLLRRRKQNEATRQLAQNAIVKSLWWCPSAKIQVNWAAPQVLGYVVKIGSLTLQQKLPVAG